MRKLAIAASLLALTLPAQANPTLDGVASGLYELEKNPAFLTWRVGPNGISVMVKPTALNTNYPDPAKKVEWENELSNDPKFFNAGAFPAITFVSTGIEQTGEFEGEVTGDVTFLGVTKPVTLDVSYGGVANPPWFGQRDVIGFTASTTLNRSDFGMTHLEGIISDEVVIEFSGEFLQAEE